MWLPTNLGASLALWLRSDLGITLATPTTVSQWNDQSGSGDSNRNFVQATAAHQPIYNSADPAYAGLPSLSFLGAGAETIMSMVGAWSSAPASPCTAIVVGNGTSVASYAMVMLGSYPNDNWYVATAFANREDIVSVGPTYFSPTDASASPSILVNEFNDPNSTMRVNNFVPELTGQSAGAATLDRLSIGSASGIVGGGNFLVGSLVEVLVVSRLLTSVELTDALQYLSGRYGIFVGGISPALPVTDTQPSFAATTSPQLYPKNPTFQTGAGRAYTQALAATHDALINRGQQATLNTMPGLGDPSAIPYLAHDRQLVQGPSEPNSGFVPRLSGAFQQWNTSGSRQSILQELHAYLQELQPGVPATNPELAIVGGSHPTITTWTLTYLGDAIGSEPTLQTVVPSNWNWDGGSQSWRNWLILYMAEAPTSLSGTGAQVTTAAASACYASPGQNVGGVWVPATSGTPVNSPWMTITGLSGVVAANVGGWITFVGFANSGNNGTFPIVTVISGSSIVIANPNGVASDAGPATWSIGQYPLLGPGPVWGAPGFTLGGPGPTYPAADTGSNIGGAWQPSSSSIGGGGSSGCWGLVGPSALPAFNLLTTVRGILSAWKSAGSYFVDIVVAFDGGTGTSAYSYSPNGTAGALNPGGNFAHLGHTVLGIWVPIAPQNGPWDCYCAGTGAYASCSVVNVS